MSKRSRGCINNAPIAPPPLKDLGGCPIGEIFRVLRSMPLEALQGVESPRWIQRTYWRHGRRATLLHMSVATDPELGTPDADLVARLLALGADPLQHDHNPRAGTSDSALHDSVSWDAPLPLVKLLVETRQVSERRAECEELLVTAANGSCGVELAGWLLREGGFDVNVRDVEGSPPLCVAMARKQGSCLERDLAMASLFLENGARVNETDANGYTALMWAVERSDGAQLVNLLLQHFADVNKVCKQGGSALFWCVWASAAGDGESDGMLNQNLRMLVDAGANLHLKSPVRDEGTGEVAFRCTALELAQQHNLAASVATLSAAMANEEFDLDLNDGMDD